MTRIASALLAAFFLTGQVIGAVHDGATITTTSLRRWIAAEPP
jgi:hypothetical protein